MKLHLRAITALTATLLALPAMADAPKGYFQVPGVDTAIQLYGNACFDMVYDGVQPGGVMSGITGAGATTDNASPKSQWDMTMDESRFGMRTITPTAMGDIKTRFEMDFLGTNKDSEGSVPWAHPISGETKNLAHVRQMYGQWNGWLFGKADNNFEDPDGSPNYIDWDGLVGDWYGCGRNLQLRYTADLNAKTSLSVAIDRNDANGIGGTKNNLEFPKGAAINPGAKANVTYGASHSIPGSPTARLTYSDTWGHIAFAAAYTKYESFASQAFTPATSAVTGVVQGPGGIPAAVQPVAAFAAVAGSTATYSKNSFSWALSGHFQFGEDSLVYHIGIGDGQWGAGLQDGVSFNKAGNLVLIQAKQFEAGYEHFFTPKLHANVFCAYVGYDRDADKGMTGDAFHTYEQVGANLMYNATKTVQYAVEYMHGQAKTFDANTLINPDGGTTSTIGESKLHFQAKFKFN